MVSYNSFDHVFLCFPIEVATSFVLVTWQVRSRQICKAPKHRRQQVRGSTTVYVKTLTTSILILKQLGSNFCNFMFHFTVWACFLGNGNNKLSLFSLYN